MGKVSPCWRGFLIEGGAEGREMFKSDGEEYGEWFNNVLRNAAEYHKQLLNEIKKGEPTYDELLEANADLATRLWVNNQVMMNTVETLTNPDIDPDKKGIDNNLLNLAVAAGMKLQVTVNAKYAAHTKVAKDPKQKEKSFVFECWQDWQKNPDSYNGKAAFGRDMLTKCEHLTSQKKIEDWCREWKKANPAG